MKLSNTTDTLKKRVAPLGETFGESRGVQLLAGALTLQLVLAAGLMWRSNAEGDFVPTAQLAVFDPATVDEIVIDDSEGSITLTRNNDQWQMDDEQTTQASAEKIESLLASVSDLQPGLPVANTSSSHDQLEVAKDNFQRKLILKAGSDVVADLYLGTSPGFRKSHARTADEDSVYSVKLNTFDIPADKGGWLDNDLLAFTDVKSIQSSDMELALKGDNWSIIKPQDKLVTHEVDNAELSTVVDALKTLRVTGFAEPIEPDEESAEVAVDIDLEAVDASEPLISHEITVVQADSPVTLKLVRKDSTATIERSDVNGLFALPVSTFDALADETLQNVLVEKDADTPEPVDQPNG